MKFDFIIVNLKLREDFKFMENKELKERFIDEKTGIEYIRQGDYNKRINIYLKLCNLNGKILNFMI